MHACDQATAAHTGSTACEHHLRTGQGPHVASRPGRKAAGLTRQTISDVERCVANPTIDALERVANALGVTLDPLLVPPIAERAKRGDKADRVNARDLLATVADAAGRPSRRYRTLDDPAWELAYP